MDVLNTTGGEAVISFVWYGWIVLAVAVICSLFMTAWEKSDDHVLGRLLCFIFVVGTIIYTVTGGFERETGELTPIRHEVTLRPGHVIDATKYEIVEQRGKIYVIEEREAAE